MNSRQRQRQARQRQEIISLPWLVGLLVGSATLFLVCIAGCPTVIPPGTPESTPGLGTGWQPGIDPLCLDEQVPLAPECNEGPRLPWCAAEDSGQDGSPNEPCYWRDPSTGNLWYDDGDGVN